MGVLPVNEQVLKRFEHGSPFPDDRWDKVDSDGCCARQLMPKVLGT
jgi:hypothetical protein